LRAAVARGVVAPAMKKLLVERAQAQLLLIDAQEKLLATMPDRTALERNLSIHLKAAAHLGLPTTVTLQNPEKLGDMPDAIAQHLHAPAVFSKMAFSAWREKLVEAHLKHSTRMQVILVGIETHVCVLQTALDLVEKGYQIFVPHDAVMSRADENRRWALTRMRDNGVTVTSTESVLFELLGTAGTDEFRALRGLIA
jgi:nicotinamidase-related amidase